MAHNIRSAEKSIWEKALWKFGTFHTTEPDIDGCITHWKSIVYPVIIDKPEGMLPNGTQVCLVADKKNKRLNL